LYQQWFQNHEFIVVNGSQNSCILGSQNDAISQFSYSGEVAERFKAAVLKTVEEQSSGGSNPSLSANSSFHDIGVSISAGSTGNAGSNHYCPYYCLEFELEMNCNTLNNK
jgi:hypothetical protein